MSVPQPVHLARVQFAAAVLLSLIGSAVFAPSNLEGAAQSGFSLLEFAVLTGLMWKLCSGSTAARFAYAASVIFSAVWSLTAFKGVSAAWLVELVAEGLQVVSVWYLYRPEAGLWFARQKIEGLR